MQDESPFRLFSYRAGYAGLGILLVLWSVVPFDMRAGALPRPDVFYCITMVYVIRRPEWAPVWLIFGVFFLRDILTQAPLGLFTLLIVMGSEVVRANIQAFREYFFGLEWVWIGGIFVAITLVQQVLLVLTLSQTPRFVEQLYLILFTVAIYPVTVAVMKFGFGFTRPRPGELDAWGKRL